MDSGWTGRHLGRLDSTQLGVSYGHLQTRFDWEGSDLVGDFIHWQISNLNGLLGGWNCERWVSLEEVDP